MCLRTPISGGRKPPVRCTCQSPSRPFAIASGCTPFYDPSNLQHQGGYMRRVASPAAIAAGSIVALAVATAAVAAFTSKVSVDPSPVAACPAPAVGGTLTNNTEVEPFVAANPAKAGNLIAVWQQDRWSNGGAHALMAARSTDGGKSWTSQTALPFNECVQGGLSYERASDPWVS